MAVSGGWSLSALFALKLPDMRRRAPRADPRQRHPRFTECSDWPHAQPSTLLDTFSAAVEQDAIATRQRFITLLNQGDNQARTIGRA